MFLIVDLIVIGILILCIFIGYKRGLTGCLINILSFFIALAVAIILFKPASAIIINNTQIDNNIQNSIISVFEDSNQENSSTTNEEEASPILQYISEEIENATEEKKNEIVKKVSEEISIKIINILSFIILFILARIAIRFVKAIANIITKLPLIKQCDKIGGIVYGTIQGFVIVFIGFTLITFISTIVNNYSLLETINQSYIGKILCNNNILLKVIF